nr:MAG TPA: hypothetical protein [Caudoviricetes sp.]
MTYVNYYDIFNYILILSNILKSFNNWLAIPIGCLFKAMKVKSFF